MQCLRKLATAEQRFIDGRDTLLTDESSGSPMHKGKMFTFTFDEHH